MEKILTNNRRAGFLYEIRDKFEAGLELTGPEVKSMRLGRANLNAAHVIVRGGEAYLVNADVPAYQAANSPRDYNPRRPRRLLLKYEEIEQLAQAVDHDRLTIVPLSIYNKGRRLKLSLATARGKKRYDKREVLKKRESDRQIRRSLKNF